MRNDHDQKNVASIFWSYNAHLIAQWCQVSIKTAYDWKKGRKLPSRRAVRLFQLHATQRIFPDSWRGWTIDRQGTLWSPDGIPATQEQILALPFLRALARELERPGQLTQLTLIQT